MSQESSYRVAVAIETKRVQQADVRVLDGTSCTVFGQMQKEFGYNRRKNER